MGRGEFWVSTTSPIFTLAAFALLTGFRVGKSNSERRVLKENGKGQEFEKLRKRSGGIAGFEKMAR